MATNQNQLSFIKKFKIISAVIFSAWVFKSENLAINMSFSVNTQIGQLSKQLKTKIDQKP